MVSLSDRPINYQTSQEDFTVLLDPIVLRAARKIYRTFYEVHPNVVEKPIGIAIDRHSLRGQLVFGKKPILLPSECFVPFSLLESGDW